MAQSHGFRFAINTGIFIYPSILHGGRVRRGNCYARLWAMAGAGQDISRVFIELGACVAGLAVLARVAARSGFSAIPFYLLGGLAFGNGGLAPLNLSGDFIHIGAEIGVLLLLFMLGLEYTGAELKENLRTGLSGGIVDFALNFPPGLIAGLAAGWNPLPAVLPAKAPCVDRFRVGETSAAHEHKQYGVSSYPSCSRRAIEYPCWRSVQEVR